MFSWYLQSYTPTKLLSMNDFLKPKGEKTHKQQINKKV